MKHFHRYVLKTFLTYILVIEGLILVLAIFGSAMQDSELMTKFNVGIGKLLLLELLATPTSFQNTLPMAVLAATIVTLIVLQRNREIIAYFALGGRVRTLLIPFVVAGTSLMLLMLFTSEFVIPKARFMQEKYRKEVIEKKSFYLKNRLNDVWLKDQTKLVHIVLIDPLDKQFTGVTEYHFDNTFRVTKVISYPVAKPVDGKWFMDNKTVYDYTIVPPGAKTQVKVTEGNQLLTDLIEMPGENFRFLTSRELSKLIKIKKKVGLNTDRYEQMLLSKFATPLSILTLIILLVPFGVTHARSGSTTSNLSSSLGIGLLFWVLSAVCNTLGGRGILSPFEANFLPHIIFLVTGAFMIYRKEQS